MESVYLQSEYVVVSCGADGCDQHFAMSRRFYNETHESHITWYCPRGHPRMWRGKTTAQKLEAAEARQRHLEDQLLASEAQAEQVRVRLIRDRHRFANGVCPCCNRSFEALARHMKTQHPDYDPADLDAGAAGPVYRCSCGRKFDTPRGLKIHQSHQRRDDWTDPNRGSWGRHLTVV